MHTTEYAWQHSNSFGHADRNLLGSHIGKTLLNWRSEKDFRH